MASNHLLLARLEAHGAEFIRSFTDLGDKKKITEKRTQASHSVELNVGLEDIESDSAEEWTGFASTNSGFTNSEDCGEYSRPRVVVFSEGTAVHRDAAANTQRGTFMSSKIARLRDELSHSKENNDDSAEEDTSNIQNDALLHRLVHTQLLSGSLNPELNMTAAQRRKALAGRVLEISGDSKLGKGEKAVRQKEKMRASKRVRDGMMAKQKEREAASLNEAKNVGNYHPTLKKVLMASSHESRPRKRERGLRMGIGKFSGGVLKLRPEDVGNTRAGSHQFSRDRRAGKSQRKKKY